MALLPLAEGHADGDRLRELGQLVLQRLMDAEAEALCGHGPGRSQTVHRRDEVCILMLRSKAGRKDGDARSSIGQGFAAIPFDRTLAPR